VKLRCFKNEQQFNLIHAKGSLMSMSTISFLTNIIEITFGLVLFINALLFVPQAVRILKEKSAVGVSLLTFVGFLLIQFVIVLHGIIHQDYPLIMGYLISMLSCGVVIILALIYKSQDKKIQDTNISLEEIIAQLPEHIYWKDKNGVCLGCNTNNWREFGLNSLAEFKGKTDYDLFTKDEADNLTRVDQEVMRTGQVKIVEEKSLTANGKTTVYLSHKLPLKNKLQDIVGILGISVDVTHYKNAESELNFAKETAVTANQEQTKFLYGMRHDLKTPVCGIIGIAEHLENTEEDPNKREYLGYIRQASKALLDQLDQVFEFTCTENGQLPVIETQFNLHHLVSDTFKMMIPAAKHKSLSFTTELDEDLPQLVVGDHVRTQRILINLITNSIKFTEKGHVKLLTKVVKTDDKNKIIVQFIVEDSGLGISEEKRNVIFEPFNRLTTRESDIYPEQGLGLRMIKKFLDEIDGEVVIESKHDQGSIFNVFIPFRQSLLAS
jgi:two-component system aerobic respiration control sensor histidine kinase ArcB